MNQIWRVTGSLWIALERNGGLEGAAVVELRPLDGLSGRPEVGVRM